MRKKEEIINDLDDLLNDTKTFYKLIESDGITKVDAMRKLKQILFFIERLAENIGMN